MPDAPDAAPVPIGYAPAAATARARVLRRLRPGTAGFFLLMTLLIAAGAWGGWKLLLSRDRKAFEACVPRYGRRGLVFDHLPSRGALRHLARQPGGPWRIDLDWPAAEWPAPWAGIAALNLSELSVGPGIDADALLVALARPGSGPKTLTVLWLDGTRVTDAGAAALARPDSGLKALTDLHLSGTPVTAAGIEALRRARPPLKIYR